MGASAGEGAGADADMRTGVGEGTGRRRRECRRRCRSGLGTAGGVVHAPTWSDTNDNDGVASVMVDWG